MNQKNSHRRIDKNNKKLKDMFIKKGKLCDISKFAKN